MFAKPVVFQKGRFPQEFNLAVNFIYNVSMHKRYTFPKIYYMFYCSLNKFHYPVLKVLLTFEYGLAFACS